MGVVERMIIDGFMKTVLITAFVLIGAFLGAPTELINFE